MENKLPFAKIHESLLAKIGTKEAVNFLDVVVGVLLSTGSEKGICRKVNGRREVIIFIHDASELLYNNEKTCYYMSFFNGEQTP